MSVQPARSRSDACPALAVPMPAGPLLVAAWLWPPWPEGRPQWRLQRGKPLSGEFFRHALIHRTSPS